MKRYKKILLGLATFWPLIYLIVFLVFFMFLFYSFAISSQTNSSANNNLDNIFLLIFPLHLITMIWIFALLIVYVIIIFRNERLVGDKQLLWIIIIFVGGILTMPFYWYIYVWKEPLSVEN